MNFPHYEPFQSALTNFIQLSTPGADFHAESSELNVNEIRWLINHFCVILLKNLLFSNVSEGFLTDVQSAAECIYRLWTLDPQGSPNFKLDSRYRALYALPTLTFAGFC